MENNNRQKWMISSGKRGNCGLKTLTGKSIVEQVEWTVSGYEFTYYFDDQTTTIVDWNGRILRTVKGVDSYLKISDGMLAVEDLTNEKSGYISLDLTKCSDIPCEHHSGRAFHNGFAAVKELVAPLKTAWGVINKSGEFVIAPRFLEIAGFTDKSGVSPFIPKLKDSHDEKVWGLLNQKGDIVVPPIWSAIQEGFYDGHLVAQTPGEVRKPRWGLADPTGHWCLPPEWESLSEHINEQSIGAKKNGLWGVIDTRGKWVVEPRFGYCAAFHQGLSRAAVKGSDGEYKRGYIDINGKWVIEPKYDDCWDFQFGLGAIDIYDKATDSFQSGFVDANGVEYWEDK